MTEVNRNGVKALVTQEKGNPFLRVRIPYKGTQQQKQPLHDALVDSAKAAGITPLQMAIYTNFFLEQVGEQMIRGRIVRIPGFGLFGPRTRFRYVRARRQATGAFVIQPSGQQTHSNRRYGCASVRH